MIAGTGRQIDQTNLARAVILPFMFTIPPGLRTFLYNALVVNWPTTIAIIPRIAALYLIHTHEITFTQALEILAATGIYHAAVSKASGVGSDKPAPEADGLLDKVQEKIDEKGTGKL